MLSQEMKEFIYNSMTYYWEKGEQSLILCSLYLKYQEKVLRKYGINPASFDVNLIGNMEFYTKEDASYEFEIANMECCMENNLRLLEILEQEHGLEIEHKIFENYGEDISEELIEKTLEMIPDVSLKEKEIVLDVFSSCKGLEYPQLFICHDERFGIKEKRYLRKHTEGEYAELKEDLFYPFYYFKTYHRIEKNGEEWIFVVVGENQEASVQMDSLNLNFIEARMELEEKNGKKKI